MAQLNEAFSKNAGSQGWDYRAGADLWKQAPPFDYNAPPPGFALRTHVISALSLFAWLVLALGLALRSAQRVRVV